MRSLAACVLVLVGCSGSDAPRLDAVRAPDDAGGAEAALPAQDAGAADVVAAADAQEEDVRGVDVAVDDAGSGEASAEGGPADAGRDAPAVHGPCVVVTPAGYPYPDYQGHPLCADHGVDIEAQCGTFSSTTAANQAAEQTGLPWCQPGTGPTPNPDLEALGQQCVAVVGFTMCAFTAATCDGGC